MDDKSVVIKIKWNAYNTSLVTSKLYRDVEKGRISEAEIRVKKGSFLSDIVIPLLRDLGAAALWDFIKYLSNRMRQERKRREPLPQPIIIVNNVTINNINLESKEGLDELRKRFF